MPPNDDTVFLMIDRRLMAKILTKDVTCDWRTLLTLWSHDLIDYIFANLQIDCESKKVDIYN